MPILNEVISTFNKYLDGNVDTPVFQHFTHSVLASSESEVEVLFKMDLGFVTVAKYRPNHSNDAEIIQSLI
jgi:phosphoglycerol transferase MdoB-like AlkP superfamily enzyme